MQITSSDSSVSTLDPRSRAEELLDQSLLGIEMLVEGGRGKAAAAALRTLLNRTTPEAAARILERAAIAELAREQGWEPPQRQDVRWVVPSRVQRRRVEPRRLTRTQLAEDRAERRGDAAAAVYLAERDQTPVLEDSGWDDPVWGKIDYDRAALAGLRGAPCLSCKLERTRADLANRDGLCVECRDSGLTRDGVIQSRCALVADSNPGERAAEMLRKAWKRATRPEDRDVITAWVTQNRARLAS